MSSQCQDYSPVIADDVIESPLATAMAVESGSGNAGTGGNDGSGDGSVVGPAVGRVDLVNDVDNTNVDDTSLSSTLDEVDVSQQLVTNKSSPVCSCCSSL